jgi:hypothetical protein
MDLISIQLVKNLSRDIKYESYEQMKYITYLPVGWYKCSYVNVDSENDSSTIENETILVYEFNRAKYENMLEKMPEYLWNKKRYGSETVNESALYYKATKLVGDFFDDPIDNFDDELITNVQKLIRHVAQNDTKPVFFDYSDRKKYDMDQVVKEITVLPGPEIHSRLEKLFNDSQLHWKLLYKDFNTFRTAYDNANRLYYSPPVYNDAYGESAVTLEPLTHERKQEIRKKNENRCHACYSRLFEEREIRYIEIDHIIPVSRGGNDDEDNLQCLCEYCHNLKGTRIINFKKNSTSLLSAPNKLQLFNPPYSEATEWTIARIVNWFYQCAACAYIDHPGDPGSGDFEGNTGIFEIVLYKGNDPHWLDSYKPDLLKFIIEQLQFTHIRELQVTIDNNDNC